MIIFFTIFLFLLIARANSYLLSYEILNIDESQMMANAIRFDFNNYNIFEFDGTSSGFLNSLVLNWPNIFGLDVTFLSTRLTAIIILTIIFYLLFLYFKIELGKFLSLLVISPGLIFSLLPVILTFNITLVNYYLLYLLYFAYLVLNFIQQKNFL